jgi:cytochrome P450
MSTSFSYRLLTKFF